MKTFSYIVILFSTLNVLGQEIESQLNLFILPKSIKTPTRVTEENIKDWDKEMLASVTIWDKEIIQKLHALLPQSDSSELSDYSGVDVRFLIELKDTSQIRTIAFSNNGLLAINSRMVFEFPSDSIIELLKSNIPPNLEWYEADPKDIKSYQLKRIREQLNGGQ